MIKVHQTNFMPGIKTSINKNFVNNIFVMIMKLGKLRKYCAMKIWSYTIIDWFLPNLYNAYRCKYMCELVNQLHATMAEL